MLYTAQELKDIILPILTSMGKNYDGVADALVMLILQEREQTVLNSDS